MREITARTAFADEIEALEAAVQDKDTTSGLDLFVADELHRATEQARQDAIRECIAAVEGCYVQGPDYDAMLVRDEVMTALRGVLDEA